VQPVQRIWEPDSMRWMGDRLWLKLYYRHRMGRRLRLRRPVLFTEKLQWLKLYDRRPVYAVMADKLRVRDWIKQTFEGGQPPHSIPLLGVWERAEDIDFDALPNQFVLKCNHDSASYIICKNKSQLDIPAAREKLDFCLRRDYSMPCREWCYKDIPRRILAEEYMEDDDGEGLKDYKFFACNGEPTSIEIHFDRTANHQRINYYDLQWNLTDCSIPDHPRDPDAYIPKPVQLEEMLGYIRKIAVGIPFLRVDFYVIRNKVYFGECTFYPEAGYSKFSGDYDRIFGDMIQLPKKPSAGG